LKFKKNSCKDLIPISDSAIVIGLCNLLDAISEVEGELDSKMRMNAETVPESFYGLIEKWFPFAVVWSLCASVNEESRNKIDFFMRDIETIFPPTNSVYDYFYSNEKNE
jgi:dynein heavy chain